MHCSSWGFASLVPEIVESQSTPPGRDWTLVPNPWRIDDDLSSSVNHWDHDTDCRCAVPTFELCRVIQWAVLYIRARTRRSVYEPQSMKLVKAARVKLRRFHVERGTRSQDLCNQRHPKICAYCRHVVGEHQPSVVTVAPTLHTCMRSHFRASHSPGRRRDELVTSFQSQKMGYDI
jgi:hypothetical protein